MGLGPPTMNRKMTALALASSGLVLHRSLDGYAEIRRTISHGNAGSPQCGDLFLGRTTAAADDRSGVTHALARWRRLTGNKCRHRLRDVLLDEFGRAFLS